MPDKFKHTILVVDDEEGILKALRRLLKNLEADVITVNNGSEALEILKNNQVSLIISDQRMPEMTGVELLHRSRDISPNSVRILLTGYADIEATIEAINSGAIKYYFNKPWDDEFLLSRIRESLDLYKMAVENKKLNILLYRQNEKLKNLNKTLEQRVAEQTKEITKKHEELNKSFMETIKSFSIITEMRYTDVGSQSLRVATLADKLCKSINLGHKEYQDIVVASYIHDIGKVGISDKILKKKPRDYSKADRDEIKKHPILGQSCVSNINGFEEIGIIIRHHHENYNGSGYPDNIREKRIPLGSRIIRIANEFDKLSFENGYPSMNKLNESAAYLVKFSDSHFDPDLVKKFIEYDIAKCLPQKDSLEAIVVKTFEIQVGMILAEDINTVNGMFLMPKGAKLSNGIIKRIIKIDSSDPIDGGISVYRHTIPKEKTDEQLQDIIG